jgi:hypothetical protein
VRTTTAPRREALAATPTFVATLPATDLRLRSGDERRQTVNACIVGGPSWLGLLLKLRLWSMLSMVLAFARLMLIAWLIGLPIALVVALMIARIVTLLIRLLLHRDEAGLLPET